MMKLEKRVKGQGRKPPRSFLEMADEFGVSVEKLASCFARYGDAPKPVLDLSNRSASHRQKWYDAQEVRKWWKSIEDQRKNA